MEVLCRARESHVCQVITHDGTRRVSTGACHLLHNVAKVVNNEGECCPSLGNGTQQAVYCAHNRLQYTGHIVQGANQQGIKIERLEYAIDNIDEVTEAYNELELGLNVHNGKVDFLHGNGHTSIDGNETRNVGV